VLIMLFSALLWLARPKETLYGWFALGVFFWMIYLMNFIWYRAPLTGNCWLALIHAALVCSLICVQRFCRLFLGQVPKKTDFWLNVFAVACGGICLSLAIMAPMSKAFYWSLDIALRLALLALGLHLVALLARAGRLQGSAEAYWLGAASLLGLSLGFWDSAIVLEYLPRSTPFIFQLGILPLVLVFGYLLLRRFISLLDAAEAQNALLDQRVQQNSIALEQAFAQRQIFEREKLLADERHRLATDLHDGAGSQLVSLLSAVRRDGMNPQQMEQALSDAISDLRLVMDSIDSLGSDLAEALGQFRSRMEPKLSASGLKSVWRTATLSEGLRLSPRRTLNVFRALQESLVNVLKHAHASEVEISAQELGGVLRISVVDNGTGLPSDRVEKKGSRGLLSLEARMKSLGGYAQFKPAYPDATQPGLEVSLYVPIPVANETKW
jgi:signal transduction histidine kinase